jgi:transposase-like protein
MRKTPRMITLEEERLKEPIENYISRALNQGKTQTAVAEDLGITKGVMRYWMLLLGIRKEYETRGGNADGKQ